MGIHKEKIKCYLQLINNTNYRKIASFICGAVRRGAVRCEANLRCDQHAATVHTGRGATGPVNEMGLTKPSRRELAIRKNSFYVTNSTS